MFVVDSQIHLSTANSGSPRSGQISDGASAEQVLQEMDAAGVDRAVLATASWDPLSNEQCLAAARRYPDRFAVFGRIMVNEPDSRAQVESWTQQPGMRGTRINLRKLLVDAPEAAEADHWLWSAIERTSIPTMLRAAENFSLVRPIAERHPGLRLCLCHLGVNVYQGKDEAAFAHLPELLKLAELPNVAVKASGLASYSSQSYPFPRLHPILQQVYDAFGPERMFWGTDLTRVTYWDLPGRPRKCTYRQAVTMFTEELSWLSASDKELIMGRALCDWAGWPAPDSAPATVSTGA